MEPREATGKETMASKRKNLTFLRPRLYMLERRRTDTVLDSSVPGDHAGTLRRSQSDRTEYSQKLQGKPKERKLPQVAPLQVYVGAVPFAGTPETEEKIRSNFPFSQNKKMKLKGTPETPRQCRC